MDEGDLLDLISFLPPDIAIEIGRSTVSFSIMEDSLNDLISDLLNSGKVAGQAVTFTIRNITDRIELARTLAKDKAPAESRDEILSVLTKVGEANARRNTLIHQAIVEIRFGTDPQALTVQYRKKDYLIRETPKTTILSGSDFGALTTDLRLLFRALDGARNSYKLSRARAAKQPSPDTHSELKPPLKDHSDPSE
jgi:hypothetical protein